MLYIEIDIKTIWLIDLFDANSKVVVEVKRKKNLQSPLWKYEWITK